MLLRKIAGATAAGAMVLGGAATVAAPALAAETLTGSTAMNCIYGQYEMAYEAAATVTVDGTTVSVTLPRFESDSLSSVPAFVVVAKVVATTTATIAGQSVELSGEITLDEREPLSTGVHVPTLTGELPEALDGTRVSLGDLTLDLTTYAFGPNPSPAQVACEVIPGEAQELEVNQAFDCVYGTFPAIRYDAEGTIAIYGDEAELTLNDFPAMSGVPPIVTVTHADARATVDLGTEVIETSGQASHDPGKPLNTGIAIPATTGVLKHAGAPTSASLTGLTVDVVAMGQVGTMECEVVSQVESTTEIKIDRKPAKREVTVTATVTGDNPTGDVTISIAGGQDNQTATVALDEAGVAAATFTKLSNVGQYQVEVAYAGDDANIESSTTAAFKMPKIKTNTKVNKIKHAKKAKKFKQIRVRATVGNPVPGKTAGKVRIVIKQGKKNVRVVKGVKLNKNGKINRVIKGLGKKVNKKGQYRVVVQYTGNKQYQKSKAVQKFRLN